jgi:hypothetical protein
MRELSIKNNSWKMKVEKIYIKVPNSYPGKGENFRNLWSAWRGEMIVLLHNDESIGNHLPG